MNRFIARNKPGLFLVLMSGVCWWATGDYRFMFVGAGALLVGMFFRRLPRTILWAALAAYGAIVTPSGWVLVIVLAAIIACFPMFRRITPIGDFVKPETK